MSNKLIIKNHLKIKISVQNQYKDDCRNNSSSPILLHSSSDNYRKDFAHGTLPTGGGRSLNSSDSELSQSHVRSASSQLITSRRLNALHRSR